MTVENWQRVKDLLGQALALAPAQRSRFLDEACASDAALRSELDSLLSGEDEIGSKFLESPPFTDLSAAPGCFEAVADLAAGQLIAQRFQLISKIGEGGMGQVWLATQLEPVRRQVALKLIRAGMYDEFVLQRFQSERQSLAIMDHPAIAKVFDAGTTPLGQPYFVMEYVPGLPITDYCDQHKLDIRSRLALFILACEGVQHAHQKAVIHRDLKPSNILVVEVDGKPTPRIIDFGLAKATVSTAESAESAEQTMLTRFGHLMGTPGYMSPEQVDPNFRDIDTRTDVYSLGVVLYVLLTGLKPFETRRRQRPPLDEWLRQLREEEPPSPSTKVNNEREISSATATVRGTQPRQLVSQLRGDLDWITLKALERDRERRYAAPLELAADLRRYLNHEPVTARPASAGYQIRKFVRRHRFATAFIGVVAALSVVASGAALIAVKQKRAAEHHAAETLKAQARLLTQAAGQRLKDEDLAGAQSIIVEVLTNAGFAQSHDPAAISVFQEIRNADPQLSVLSGHQDRVTSATYSGDGTRIVTASMDKSARVWDSLTGAQLAQLTGHSGLVESAAFSPDGTRIVTASDDKTARIWDARTGAPLTVLVGHAGTVRRAAYSPDGARIVTASYDKTVRIWDANTGAPLAVLSGHGGTVISAAYSADGTRIVTGSSDKTVRIWDAHTGAPLAVLSGHGGSVITAAFSPDATRIVSASYDKTARIWDARTGASLTVLSGHGDVLDSAAYSPDGTRIVTASADKSARVWDAQTGASLAVLSGHTSFVEWAAYSPDGTRIVTASDDKTARIWDAAKGAPLAVLSGHASFAYSAAYSPDGARIVTASDDKTARIWDARTGAQIAALAGHGGSVMSAAYSPDGARIVTASSDMTARIWDSRTGAELALLSGHTGFVDYATYSPDGTRIVTASFDKTARIWDARTGAELALLSGHSGFVESAAYSPDATRIVTASKDKTTRIWDARTGTPVAVLAGHGGYVYFAAYSPNGTRIVTASADKTARIWDARSGAQLAVLSGHRDRVSSAAYSPDGTRIVTSSYDKTARIWDSRTGTQLAVLFGHGDVVDTAAFSADGMRIVTASDDKTARVWDARIPAPLEQQILWYAAAEIDSLPDDDRTALGLPADARVRRRHTQGSTCDQTAAAFYDPDRLAQGTIQTEIVADVANAACAEQSAGSGNRSRAAYQTARALLAKSDPKGAREQFELATSSGYRAAQVDLAGLLSDTSAGMLDPERAATLYQKAWQEGVAIAAFALGHLYEVGVDGFQGPAGSKLQPDLAKAWQWYQQGADAGEPHALARFAERTEHDALAETDAARRNAQLLNAFSYYAAAADRARMEDWPDDAWRLWRHRRASLARFLASQGLMQNVADAYGKILARDDATGISP